MNLKIMTIGLLLFFAVFLSCNKNKYPLEPVLEYVSISKVFVKQNGQDSLVLTFSYTDGDGDIGSDNVDNIFLRDKRTDQLLATYRFPNEVNQEPGAFRKGKMQLIVYSGCCIYNDSTSCVPNANQALDNMRYTIQVQDQSGKMSNVIETETVQLECN